MRAVLGFTAVHLVFALAGMALLYALGLVTRLRELPAAAGPAYFCGLAALLPVLIMLLVAGLPVRLPGFVAVSLAATAVLGVIGRRAARRREPAPPPILPTGSERWVARAAVAAIVLFFVVGATALVNLPTHGDDWAIWSHKALVLFEFGDLHPGFFDGKATGPAVPGHPILQPVLESIFFRAMAGPYLQEWHVVLWIFFATFLWTVAWLMRSRGAGQIALVPVAALALTPQSRELLAIGYADVTVASFLAAGALSIGLWLDDGRARYALLGGVLLAAAANSKSEGTAGAVMILLAAAGVVRVARLGRWRALLASAAITVGGFAAWSGWRSYHHIDNPDLRPFGEALDWNFLTGRLDILREAAAKLLLELSNQGLWTWIVPCFIALAIACLIQGTARRLASFYLASVTLMMFSLFWVYWTAAAEDGKLLLNSASRVVAGVVFVSAVGVVHLVVKVLSPDREPERVALPT